MQTEQIVALLVAERDRLNRAIDALQGPAKRRGRPPASAATSAPTGRPRKRKARTAAQRKAQSERMRAFWAARRKKEQKSK
jgi:hypothetical protein